jgi:hypothetical protein
MGNLKSLLKVHNKEPRIKVTESGSDSAHIDAHGKVALILNDEIVIIFAASAVSDN